MNARTTNLSNVYSVLYGNSEVKMVILSKVNRGLGLVLVYYSDLFLTDVPESPIWLSVIYYMSSLTIFFSQHYLELDMSKYEAHLYTDVEELDAAMGQAHCLETQGSSEEIDTMPAEH